MTYQVIWNVTKSVHIYIQVRKVHVHAFLGTAIFGVRTVLILRLFGGRFPLWVRRMQSGNAKCSFKFDLLGTESRSDRVRSLCRCLIGILALMLLIKSDWVQSFLRPRFGQAPDHLCVLPLPRFWGLSPPHWGLRGHSLFPEVESLRCVWGWGHIIQTLSVMSKNPVNAVQEIGRWGDRCRITVKTQVEILPVRGVTAQREGGALQVRWLEGSRGYKFFHFTSHGFWFFAGWGIMAGGLRVPSATIIHKHTHHNITVSLCCHIYHTEGEKNIYRFMSNPLEIS